MTFEQDVGATEIVPSEDRHSRLPCPGTGGTVRKGMQGCSLSVPEQVFPAASGFSGPVVLSGGNVHVQDIPQFPGRERKERLRYYGKIRAYLESDIQD